MIPASIDANTRQASDLPLPPVVAAPLLRSWTEAQAFEYCTAITRGHYENFPVGSFLAPRSLQPAIHSLYAFMRTADDFADEGRRPGDELERAGYLASWEQMLSECEHGIPRHPVFIALRATLDRHALPVQWLRDLLTAFKMDVTVRRYGTHEDLLMYCRYSANPVGRLVLTLFGYRDEGLYRLSDAICTGLQLANHWQDVAIDLEKDRIYLPKEDMDKFGVTEEGLRKLNPSPQPSPQGEGVDYKFPSPLGRGSKGEGFPGLMAFEVDRARALFEEGRSLPGRVSGRLRWELRMTWKGGVAILDKIEAARYDVFRRRPVVTKWDWVQLGLKAMVPGSGFVV